MANFALRKMFCAHCQRERELLFLSDGKELLAACKCGRILKWPVPQSRDELEIMLAAHNRANQPLRQEAS